MQVLQHTTAQVEDVETLQISNEVPPQQDMPAVAGFELSSGANADMGFAPEANSFIVRLLARRFRTTHSKALAASAFLVAVPVFVQAPLVRVFPTLSLLLTTLWLSIGWKLLQKAQTKLWGDLTIGFSWTWLAGAVYWGWFRWDPYVHLPIEALGLPIVLVLLRYGKAKIGNYFYLGSLLGTAITDLYFYCVGLIPYWRALMIQPPSEAGSILHSALLRMETYQGVGCAIVLLSLLVLLGTVPLRFPDAKWWAFSGAVLSTILVDSLFFVAAILA